MRGGSEPHERRNRAVGRRASPHGGILVSFERMAAILEIDTENHVAVVQPGVTLDVLDKETARTASCTPCSRREQRVARWQRGHERGRDAP